MICPLRRIIIVIMLKYVFSNVGPRGLSVQPMLHWPETWMRRIGSLRWNRNENSTKIKAPSEQMGLNNPSAVSVSSHSEENVRKLYPGGGLFYTVLHIVSCVFVITQQIQEMSTVIIVRINHDRLIKTLTWRFFLSCWRWLTVFLLTVTVWLHNTTGIRMLQ